MIFDNAELLDGTGVWQKSCTKSDTYWYAGDKCSVIDLLSIWRDSTDLDELADRARCIGGSYAFIAATDQGILAATDHCNSWPVFYSFSRHGKFVISSDAKKLKQRLNLSAFDPDSIIEAKTSGYVFSNRTLYLGLKQLRPGEIVYRSHMGDLAFKRSFYYDPVSGPSSSHEINVNDHVRRLGVAIDIAIDDVINTANGAPIFVPLSGGLDSRLIVTKLHARSYDNLVTFSYGPPGNSEAKAAQKIAEHLSLPWTYISTTHSETQKFHNSTICKEYSAYVDNYYSVPNYQDILPLIKLRDFGQLPNDSVVVNGQTGDFISGGHIPKNFFCNPRHSVVSAIIDQHCSLWPSLLDASARGYLERTISKELDTFEQSVDSRSVGFRASQFERWEYENRQSKFILNGQKCYDFLGLKWRLPLWHIAVVEEFNKTPLALRMDQSLYLSYLDSWNYMDLFTGFKPMIKAWNPLLNSIIVPISILMRISFGRERRDKAMKFARYLDRYGNHYGAFGLSNFLKNACEIRNPISLYSEKWLRSLGIF